MLIDCLFIYKVVHWMCVLKPIVGSFNENGIKGPLLTTLDAFRDT